MVRVLPDSSILMLRGIFIFISRYFQIRQVKNKEVTDSRHILFLNTSESEKGPKPLSLLSKKSPVYFTTTKLRRKAEPSAAVM